MEHKQSITEKEDKADLILKTAQRLFGIYGYEKTSMQEIADELHISKGALYYYFPDKENLYKAVITKEQSEFLIALESHIRETNDPAESLRKYSMTRLSYFKDLLNLSRIRAESYFELQPLIAITIKDFREREKNLVIKILESGKRKGIFSFNDSYGTASLFLDLLRGLRTTVLNNKKLLVIDDAEFNILSEKAMAFTEMFIRGLKYEESKK
jgi:TetR/AcrR family transcriptional regulator